MSNNVIDITGRIPKDQIAAPVMEDLARHMEVLERVRKEMLTQHFGAPEFFTIEEGGGTYVWKINDTQALQVSVLPAEFAE